MLSADAMCAAGAGVFEPNTDGLDFYESLEGMLVQINNAVAVSPTNNFNELWVLGDNGDAATGRTPRGGIVISPGDFNPERIQIDDTISSVPKANVGDRLSTPLIGVVDYAFNNYEVLIIAPVCCGTPWRHLFLHVLAAAYCSNFDYRVWCDCWCWSCVPSLHCATMWSRNMQSSCCAYA